MIYWYGFLYFKYFRSLHLRARKIFDGALVSTLSVSFSYTSLTVL